MVARLSNKGEHYSLDVCRFYTAVGRQDPRGQFWQGTLGAVLAVTDTRESCNNSHGQSNGSLSWDRERYGKRIKVFFL